MEKRVAAIPADAQTSSTCGPNHDQSPTAVAIARRDWRQLGDFVRGIRPRDILRWALVAGAAWGLGTLLWNARGALLPHTSPYDAGSCRLSVT